MDKIIDIHTNKKYSVFSKKGRNILKSYVKTLNNQRGGAVREQNNNIVLRLGQRQPQQQRNVALHTQRNPPRHRVIWNTVYNPGSATSTGFYTVQDENDHLAHLTPEQWQNLAQQSPEVRIAYEDWALSRTPEQRQFYNRLPLQTRQALYNSRIQNLINPPMLASDYELMNENRNQANRQRPFGGNNPFQRGGVDLVHYFYHIFVDGIEARDDWDRNNDRKDEAKIEKFFRDNESRRRYYVDLSDLTTGYIVLSFKSGEPSKIPENIRINSKINLRRRSRIP